MSTQAKDDSFHYIHNEIGYNYRLSNVNTAIGLAQIENIDKILTKKKKLILGIKISFKEVIHFKFMIPQLTPRIIMAKYIKD